MVIRLDPVECLLKENSDEIFDNLGTKELGRCCQVSKKWQVLVSEDKFWIQFSDILNIPKVDIKKYINCYGINSYEDLASCYKTFASKVSKCDTFVCSFVFNPGCHCTIKVGYGDVDSFPKLSENFLFMKKLSMNELGNTEFHSSGTCEDYKTYGYYVLPLANKENNDDLKNRLDKAFWDRGRELATKASFRRNCIGIGISFLVVGAYALYRYSGSSK